MQPNKRKEKESALICICSLNETVYEMWRRETDKRKEREGALIDRCSLV